MANIPNYQSTLPKDGRQKGDWATRYKNTDCSRGIYLEGLYFAFLLLIIPTIMFGFYSKYIINMPQTDAPRYFPLVKYSFAWLSGVLGGALYVLKWLFHVIAKGFWNQDRRLWHYLTPHISGALAFTFVALISSPLLYIVDRKATNSLPLVVGVSFLVGMFSDNALAKFRTIASTIFGKTDGENGTGKGNVQAAQVAGDALDEDPPDASPDEAEIKE
jgi:hypothetical protein